MPDQPAKRPPRPADAGPPLHSTEADLDAASAISAEDVARAREAAPPSVRAYLDAQPYREAEG